MIVHSKINNIIIINNSIAIQVYFLDQSVHVAVHMYHHMVVHNVSYYQ